jgi:hypothetical protein
VGALVAALVVLFVDGLSFLVLLFSLKTPSLKLVLLLWSSNRLKTPSLKPKLSMAPLLNRPQLNRPLSSQTFQQTAELC